MPSITLFETTPPSIALYPPVKIEVPERYRAELFRSELEMLRALLVDTAARLPSLRAALEHVALVEALAGLLDDYVAPAVVADVNAFAGNWHPGRNIDEAIYRQYAAACLQASIDPYRPSAEVTFDSSSSDRSWLGKTAFYRRYPQVAWMVGTVTRQYQQNLALCCSRLTEDWSDLEAYFFPGRSLAELTAIRTTGSDFHKGGAQVLLLDFRDDQNASQKLVYKPTDVERDFRIVGNTATLSAALNANPPLLKTVVNKGTTAVNLLNNQGGSLAEVITALGGGVPAIPTYDILPVWPGTALPVRADGSVSIRQSYGYLSFLSNDATDNRLTPQEAQTYYKTLGAEVAVCYLFQITDVHEQNLIVHAKLPYLIDLEMCYTGIMAVPQNTNLKTAYRNFKLPSNQRSVEGWGSRSLDYMVGATALEYPTKNEVFNADGSRRPLTANDNTELRSGFGVTFNAIVQAQGLFTAWLTAAQGVVTRILPFGTDELLNYLHRFNYQPDPQAAVTLPDQIRLQLQGFGEVDALRWGDSFYNTVNGTIANAAALNLVYDGIAPKYAFWLARQTSEDFIHGDVPAYYQKMGTATAMGSSGRPVAVDFGRGVNACASAQALASQLIALWNSNAPLLPTQYFTGPVSQIQLNYLQQLNQDAQFRQARSNAALNDLLTWR